MKNYLVDAVYNVRDIGKFNASMQTAIDQVGCGGIFLGDNLFTFEKNIGFLDDDRLMAAFNEHAETRVEKALLWRYHTLVWAAQRAMALDGDLVECACYRGTSARIIADVVDLEASGKAFYLYDLFEHAEPAGILELEAHGASLYETVRARFAGFSRVTIVKGRVPESLAEAAPERIAFLHLDLNDMEPELAALDFFFDRVVPGGSIVFDDYGWLSYAAQQRAEDHFLGERGYRVLCLPTGQGLVIK